MSASDWIQSFCALASLVTAIIIAIVQWRQGHRMEKFERFQAKKEERRYNESMNAQASAFISKYYSDRGLVPLCAIAAMYNDKYFYFRKMYNEFCHYPRELKNKILEYCNLDLYVYQTDNFFDECITELNNICERNFPEDKSLFYDEGKYIERTLTYYGKEILQQSFTCEDTISSVIAEIFRNRNMKSTPMENLSYKYGFRSMKEVDACHFVSMVAKYIAIYNDDKRFDLEKDYGSPGGYAGETIETMEDLFLSTLFEIYVHLIIN